MPRTVEIVPAHRLSNAMRDACGAEPDDYALTRRGGRTRARIIDAATASLLEWFKHPNAITDAIIGFSRNHELDPETTLIAAFPRITDLVQHGFLVSVDAPAAHAAANALAPGTSVGEFTVTSVVHLLDDTELYQVRDAGNRRGALKIVGASRSDTVASMIRREAEILALLGGSPSPALLETGVHEGRAFLTMDWCAGVSVSVAARELHAQTGRPDRVGLLKLSRSILRAYVALHSRGVVHGDVHAQNVLVAANGSVTLVDFGLARRIGHAGDNERVRRGGIGESYDPDCVRAIVGGSKAPAATVASDQYAVAAMLFRLLTNHAYVGSALEEAELYRRIIEEPPLSFEACGSEPWPDVESALSTALQKSPAARYTSMADFAARLQRARVGRRARVNRGITGALDAIGARMRERIGAEGEVIRQGLVIPPRASVAFGAAGLAWAAYRLACIRGDPEWLATADVWLHSAREMAREPGVFFCPAIGLTRDRIGDASLYHSRAGLHCVEASLATAYQDSRRRARAIERFVRSSSAVDDNRDLSFGATGTLLGCAMLREAAWPEDDQDYGLNALATGTIDRLTQWMSGESELAPVARSGNLGVAHGWAGVLYAILRWSDASGARIPSAALGRLEQLAACAEPSGRGVRWRWIDAASAGVDSAFMPGWCNGSAGFVHLWTAAHRRFGDDQFLKLAVLTGWNAWEHAAKSRNLCCGLAGRAYALLHLFRYTEDTAWLDRAKVLAMRAARGNPSGDEVAFPDSLFKGEIGLGLLAADLERPLESRMPFFEAEGWPRTEALS